MDSKPDIITIWPRSHDYPFFRAFLQWHPHLFNKVIISFTGITNPDLMMFLTNWFQTILPNKYQFVLNDENDMASDDWRDSAVNSALTHSNTEWVWFLEQDFFMTPEFINKLNEATKTHDTIGFFEANRLHPACLLLKRELIEKTPKYFGTVPNILDHFGKFTSDLMPHCNLVELKDLGLKERVDYYHMQGLTHNYNLCRDNNIAPIFKRNEFLTYNKYASIVNVDQFPLFVDQVRRVADLMPELQEERWLKSFFELYIYETL